MTPPNRQAAAKARATVNTWLRQKYKKVRSHTRASRRVRGFTRSVHHTARQQTAVESGNSPTLERLAAFRLWMWDAGMMASKKPEYRKQIADACAQFDAMLAKESAKARVRRDGKRGGGTGDTFTVGKHKRKVA